MRCQTTYTSKTPRATTFFKKVGMSRLRAFRPKEVAAKTDYDYYPKGLPEQYLADVLKILYSGRFLLNPEQPSRTRKAASRSTQPTKCHC
jgi:hypothetical protein